MKALLSATQNRLSANVASLNYVDENWGQLDYYAPFPPVKWPCCLIDIGTINWINQGKKQQEGKATITLYVANLKLTNTGGAAPDKQKAQAWKIHDIIEEVHQALHCWQPLTTSTLMYRKTTARVPRDDGIQQYIVIYEITVRGNYDTGHGLAAGMPEGGLTFESERIGH